MNLTNRCTNDCVFCLRKDKDDVKGQELWLDDENSTAQDVINQFEKIYSLTPSKEVIFCGYGEPMLKLDEMKDVAKYLKQTYSDIKIRVNTNGHANYVYKRNVVPEMKGLIDEFSVSLNGATKEEYDELSQPKFNEAYEEVKKFIKACADENISVVASVVEGYKGRHLNLEACKQIANNLGADLRVREWIPAGY
uniref:TatD family nuclease-associated radical SAM protein n=1 Tax=Candidatus Scatousia sp. TaxID=3085663 RepID=UPI00402707C0